MNRDLSRRVMAPASNMARNPTARLSYGSCTGWFSSRKCGVRFPWESLIERDALVVLESDPMVAAYSVQPETFELVELDAPRRYTPDILVRYCDQSLEYREVKPDKRFAQDPTLGGRLQAIRAACSARSASFLVWLESDIRRSPRLANSRRVQGARAFLPPGRLHDIDAWVAQQAFPINLRSLAASLKAGAEAESILLGLVGLGRLHIDLDRAITGETIVELGAGK